jgi:hypothetical protein
MGNDQVSLKRRLGSQPCHARLMWYRGSVTSSAISTFTHSGGANERPPQAAGPDRLQEVTAILGNNHPLRQWTPKP